MNRNEGNELYLKAQKLALRDYREKMLAGQSPFLPVLDDILQNVPVENQIPLGQVDIPLNLLVGTVSGSTSACLIWKRASATPSAAMSTWVASMCRRATSASAC